MKIQSVKGTRDFYPPDMRRLNWILDVWRRVSLRNGFEEYDCPIFEYLDLYTAKSGQEIVDQLFNFTDRGDRKLAIRPEMTPSLARMVNSQINTLARPIKWFSMPRLCRAENPQKGRLREFFQWNVDIIGEDGVIADAECAFVAIDAMREFGLTCDDVQVRYSSRALLSSVFAGLGIDEQAAPAVMVALDKRTKVPADTFEKMLADSLGNTAARDGIMKFLAWNDTAGGVASLCCAVTGLSSSPQIEQAVDDLRKFQRLLESFGVSEWCVYDTGVVRGLAYYTGIVYEVFDRQQSLRALAGGGRYDNLLSILGGPKVGATGFGMGDVVMGILLDEKKKFPAVEMGRKLDFFVIDGGDGVDMTAKVLSTVGAIRAAGRTADFSYRKQDIGKQLKEANKRRALQAVIVRSSGLAVKTLATGQQMDNVSMDEILSGEMKPN